MNTRDRIPESKGSKELAVMVQLAESRVLEPYSTQRLAKDGTVVNVWMTSTALVDKSGQLYAVATTERQQHGTAPK